MLRFLLVTVLDPVEDFFRAVVIVRCGGQRIHGHRSYSLYARFREVQGCAGRFVPTPLYIVRIPKVIRIVLQDYLLHGYFDAASLHPSDTPRHGVAERGCAADDRRTRDEDVSKTPVRELLGPQHPGPVVQDDLVVAEGRHESVAEEDSRP
jgi:hypothetical protein